MTKEYLLDEFIDDNTECPLEDQIDKKVSLLYDMCMLMRHGYKRDDRENAVREWLSTYTTETQINNAVKDVVVGNITLNQMLKRKGYLQ